MNQLLYQPRDRRLHDTDIVHNPGHQLASFVVFKKTKWKFMNMGEQLFSNTNHQIPGYAKYDDILGVGQTRFDRVKNNKRKERRDDCI